MNDETPNGESPLDDLMHSLDAFAEGVSKQSDVLPPAAGWDAGACVWRWTGNEDGRYWQVTLSAAPRAGDSVDVAIRATWWCDAPRFSGNREYLVQNMSAAALAQNSGWLLPHIQFAMKDACHEAKNVETARKQSEGLEGRLKSRISSR